MSAENTGSLTVKETRLKLLLRVLAFVYVGALLLYMLPSIAFIPSFLKPFPFLNDPAFANNSTIKMGLFIVLCFIGAADVRKYLVAVEVMIVAGILSMIVGLLMFFFLDNNYIMQVGNSQLSIKLMILGSVFFDGLIAVLLIVFYRSAQKARYELLYLSTMQFRTLKALAEVVIHGENEVITAKEVAINVDRYLASFNAKSKAISKFSLTGIEIYPLFFLKPPISYMRPDDRKKVPDAAFLPVNHLAPCAAFFTHHYPGYDTLRQAIMLYGLL
jgi:hypothetical protein